MEAREYRIVGERVVPDWLTAVDEPWLGRMVELARVSAGERQGDVEQRLAEVPGPPGRVERAARTLLGLSPAARADGDARRVRALVFGAGAKMERDEAIASVGMPEEELWRRAFADLPSERRYRPPSELPSAAELALRANLALVQRLVQRAIGLRIVLHGNARDVVRHVRRQGLICVARPVPAGVELEVSGVTSLFRRTTLYGRALASVVPRLRWCERFVLEAKLVVGGKELLLKHVPEDPVWPSAPPRRFDSRVEEQFARDLAKAGWESVREPEAVQVDGRLIFPDFAIGRRGEDTRWLVEIVGFWTPEYLRAKVADLRGCGLRGMVVCVDAQRNVGEGDLPPELAVVRYTKKVDVAEVIAAAERMPAGTERPGVKLEKLELRDYFLDFAGRLSYEALAHGALERLKVGDPVRLVQGDGGLFVEVDGVKVAALSAKARQVWGPRIGRVTGARVREIALRTSAQTASAWRGRLKVDRWRVPLVDVMWVDREPGPH